MKIEAKKDSVVYQLRQCIFRVLAKNEINLEQIAVEHPEVKSFGDYSTNVAMLLAKIRKENPNEIAKEIKEKLEKNIDGLDFIEKIEVVGGFINFYLKSGWLVKQAERVNYEIEFKNELAQYGKDKTMVIDYSAPNIAKPFGIGHLRSTDIGQAIYNIYKILGWNCIGDNHLGDWGTQFGKLMVAIKKWNNKNVEDLSIDDLEKLYVKFHAEEEAKPELEDEAREWFAKLEKGDAEAKDLWQKCVEISLREFNKVYEVLDVKIDYALGESFYLDKMDAVLKMMEEKKILKDSQGAKIVEFPKMPIAIVTKSNGTTTYLLRDLATIKYRMEKWNPDLIIYEVGADQELYFRQVFASANMLGWNPEFYHVAHGMIRWKDGKFSTRKGKTIHLEEVIDKAMMEAKKIAESTYINKKMTAEEKDEMIKAVAIGAIKFSDLASDPKRDVIFSWDKIMSLDGDSGPYLQYAYARCQSVLAKSKIIEQKNLTESIYQWNSEEKELLGEFYRFEEKIIEAAEKFAPSIVVEYLISIARKYNEFYGKHRILEEPEEVQRIFLTKVTASVLAAGLKLLGIKPIEKM